MAARSNDPIKSGARKAKTRRRVGQGAVCTACGESRAEMLAQRSRPKLCRTCYALKQGKKHTEDHHWAADANSPITVAVPVNDHAMLTDAQHEWPPGMRGNADGSPLVAAAAFLHGTADFIETLIVNGLRCVADFLHRLDSWLREHMDQHWWKGTEFDGWQVA